MCLAIPGQILNIEGEDPLQLKGKVDFCGIVKDISLVCVPEATVGQYVLVHVGVAISVIDEDEANKIFEYLKEVGALEELEDGNDAIH